MKQVQFWKHAPEGHAYSLTAFDSQLGREVPLKVDDGPVVPAKIMNAEVNRHDGCRSVLLTVEVDDAFAEYFSEPDAVYDFGVNIQH